MQYITKIRKIGITKKEGISLCFRDLILRFDFEYILADEGKFFLIWRIWIIPLSVVREAIAEGAVASHLAVRAEAAGGHKWRSQIDDGLQFFRS